MSRIRINHSIFPLGQVSGGVLGNLDMEMYNNALQICKNFVPRAVGGLRKRVGSRFLAKLPNGVDGLRPIILPYYVTDVDYSLISLLIVIIPQPKAQANNNFHEPRIRFYNLEENDWIKKDNVIFEIKFKVATGLLDHPYVFPICPSFEQLQSVQTIQNGNSIILFSKFFPLVIEKAYPFSIKMQDFTVGPYSFRTSGLMLHPRIIKEENEHSTPLALKKIVIYDVLKGNIPSSNLLLSPPIFLSGLLINKAFPELLNQGLDANSYSVFSNDSLTFSGTSFGNTNQRIVVMYKNSDSAKPDLAWNGVIQDVRITKRTDNDAYVATLVVKWINEECPQDASNDNTVPLPGTEPTNSNIPDSGPQETSNWYMSTISLDSSLLGELQFNENEEDKKVYVQELQNEDFTQTRNPLENFTNLRRGGSGFPKCVLLYDGRLFLANIGDDVNGIWGSSKKLSDWFNFKPGIDSGDGVRQKISTTRMGFINWLAATSRLFVGTQEGVYIGGSVNSSSESVITSSGVSFNLISKISTSELRPVAAADSLLFTDIKGTSLFEIVLDSGGVYRVNEISLLSGGFLDPGVASHTWLEHPDKCYFAALKNGILRSVTYMKNNNIIGWAQHYLGANAHDAFVKSVDSMLVDNYNELIMVVERNINGENALYLEGIRGIEEEENDLSNVYADCAKLFQVDFDIYAIKRSRFFAITPNFNLGEAVDRNNSPIFFWTGGENTTIFEKNVGFSFFMGDANQDFIQCENGSVTDENWNPPADYENLVHIFGWKNSVPSLADGIITITMTDRAHFEEKLLILPGFSATFGGQSADFLQNKDAVFWMNHEGQVCSRDEPHNPVQFQLEEGAMANIDPSFELGTLDHINVNVIGAVNARVVIDDSVDEVRKSLNDQ
ncbi:MAG: hypothetical protein LBB63_00910, partial [Holosporaceae bacterium]|nr:hypothetical protein [Holosporaceae bacterium]